MARRRRDKSPASIKLKQPDRSAPTESTLLDMAQQQGLFEQARQREEAIKAAAGGGANKPAQAVKEDEEPLPPAVERFMETILWTISLATLHFTLDVLVQNQYAQDMSWPTIVSRTAVAFVVLGFLFYTLHPHPSNPTILPGLPSRYQSHLRQAIFFVTSISAGCYLIHISDRYGYLAVMKQAPPLGCLWIWSVIELDLPLAMISLAGAAAFFWQGDYKIR